VATSKSGSAAKPRVENLTQLRELLSAATPGPWKKGTPNRHCLKHDPPHPGGAECEYTFIGWYEGEGWKDIYPAAGEPDYKDVIAGMWDYEEGGISKPEDAALIVAAVNSLPALLDVAEAALSFADFATCLDPDCEHKVCVLNRAFLALDNTEPRSSGDSKVETSG
jgi:hypothetical protein